MNPVKAILGTRQKDKDKIEEIKQRMGQIVMEKRALEALEKLEQRMKKQGTELEKAVEQLKSIDKREAREYERPVKSVGEPKTRFKGFSGYRGC